MFEYVLQQSTIIGILDYVGIWGPILGFIIIWLTLGKHIRQWFSFIREEKNKYAETKEQTELANSIIDEMKQAKDEINQQVGFSIFSRDLEIKWTDGEKSKVDSDKKKNKVIAILKSNDTSNENFAKTW